MRNTLFLVPLAFCLFVNSVFSQKSSDPELVGTWRPQYEDYAEFIYHRLEAFGFFYLKENPNAKMVARLCSRKSMVLALVDADGAAVILPSIARNLVPMDSIFFARWSKCESRSEQYWFVPENSKFEYDEMIPVERVRVNRSLVSYYRNPSSQPARSEFEKILKEFVAELKNNPKTAGFIIRHSGVSNRSLTEVLQQLRSEKVEETRFLIVRKQIYKSYYPEFMTVTITQ